MTVPDVHVRRLSDRRGLADEVYEVLVELLMDRHIEPGQRVSIDGLSRQLSVSQTPLREALARLAAEGLVDKHPGRGYLVTDLLAPHEMDLLFEFRMAVEPEAARLSVERADATALSELQRLDEAGALAASDTSGDGFRGFRNFSDNDSRFHTHIALCSGNTFIADAVSRIRAQRHLHRYQRQIEAVTDASREHHAIVEAVLARDPEAAAQAMIDHLTASHDRFSATHA